VVWFTVRESADLQAKKTFLCLFAGVAPQARRTFTFTSRNRVLSLPTVCVPHGVVCLFSPLFLSRPRLQLRMVATSEPSDAGGHTRL
jgi:hypothetical protein